MLFIFIFYAAKSADPEKIPTIDIQLDINDVFMMRISICLPIKSALWKSVSPSARLERL